MFMDLFADLIDMFKQTQDVNGENLFDSTLISYGSNLRTGHGLKDVQRSTLEVQGKS